MLTPAKGWAGWPGVAIDHSQYDPNTTHGNRLMSETTQKNTGIRRILKAAGFSVQGLMAAFKNEAAFRQELLLSVICIPLALFVADGPVERTVLIGVTVLVLVVELLNSAIEALVDRVGLEHHELSGRAKDMGSAAVFLSLGVWLYAWIDISIN